MGGDEEPGGRQVCCAIVSSRSVRHVLLAYECLLSRMSVRFCLREDEAADFEYSLNFWSQSN